MEAAAGDGDPEESVVDPDMVALFDDSPSMAPRAEPYHYVLRDTEHKGLCLRDGHLVAANLLSLFSSPDSSVPFTFFKSFSGSTHSFEAAAFPGRFLCTVPQPDRELGLAPRAAPGSITSFYMRRHRAPEQ